MKKNDSKNNANENKQGKPIIAKQSTARKSKNDKELWERICKEVKAKAKKEKIWKIAQDNGVSDAQVKNDLKKYWMTEQAKETSGINFEIITLEEVINKAFLALEGSLGRESKAGMMKVIIDATKEIAILRGARDVDGSNKTFIGGNLEELTKRFQKAGKK